MNGCCCRSDSADPVEQIVGSYKAISIEGGFKINNLMGIRPEPMPVSVINAVIDLDFVRSPAGDSRSPTTSSS